MFFFNRLILYYYSIVNLKTPKYILNYYNL